MTNHKDAPPPTYVDLKTSIVGMVDASVLMRKHLEQVESDLRAMIERLDNVAPERDQAPDVLSTFGQAITQTKDNIDTIDQTVVETTFITAEILLACDMLVKRPVN
jgi:hypothetical protein